MTWCSRNWQYSSSCSVEEAETGGRTISLDSDEPMFEFTSSGSSSHEEMAKVSTSLTTSVTVALQVLPLNVNALKLSVKLLYFQAV